MNAEKTGILVTGASGFIGRHFVITVSDQYRLFCLARRSRKEAGIPHNDNITWIQSDITNMDNLIGAARQIREKGGVEYVLHLAGYYDFTMDDNPAYEHTNVGGTLNMIQMSQVLGVRHFIYSSSLAACKFPVTGESLTESSRTDADFPYARSKKRSEEIIRQYRNTLPCTIIRLAAVYSDWCENPPLNMILKKWLTGNKLTARVLPGKGASAMPYIHIKDLIQLFVRVIEISDRLPGFSILIASPQGCVSHRELFRKATTYFYGRERSPFMVPKALAGAGLFLSHCWNRMTGKPYIEQPWMAEYIDKQLRVDASATCRITGWQPDPRYHILRRMLFLTENLKNHPNNWAFRNDTQLKRFAIRKSSLIYDIMTGKKDTAIETIANEIRAKGQSSLFPNYRQIPSDQLKQEIRLLYEMLADTVKGRDRTVMQNFARIMAAEKYMHGFSADEIRAFMMTTGKNVKQTMVSDPRLMEGNRDQTRRIDDYIIHTIQLAADEADDIIDMMKTNPTELGTGITPVEPLTNSEPLRQMIRRIDRIRKDPLAPGTKKNMSTSGRGG